MFGLTDLLQRVHQPAADGLLLLPGHSGVDAPHEPCRVPPHPGVGAQYSIPPALR